ncbi:MAG TPA: hypothetical protein VGG74_23730 [Kofleriaceae bacterium]|jgi:hypothetical protein
MRGVVLLASLAIAACGPSDAEIRSAKTTIYYGNSAQILQLAEQGAMDENYKIGTVDDGHLSFETEGRFYSPTGDLQSEGAGGYVKVDNHSVKVSFIVVVDELADGQFRVDVKPRTWQYLAGSPQMRELDPTDPGLPPWVLGRADHLSLAIHDRLQGMTTPSH